MNRGLVAAILATAAAASHAGAAALHAAAAEPLEGGSSTDGRAPAAPSCTAARAGARLAELLARRRFVDVHLLGELLATLCPDDTEAPRWRILDAMALLRLDEPAAARDLLSGIAASKTEHADRARIVLAWSYLRDGDRRAYAAAAAMVRAPARGRLAALAATGDRGHFRRASSALDAALRLDALAAHDRYLAARCKRPWLAGLLSAVVPGAGQVYAGSWQGAAISFVLNGVLIGATVELVRNELYLTAAATGLAASVFYVGNILNAADLAARWNDTASELPREHLERLLLPELSSY